jgi:hypothetical protein
MNNCNFCKRKANRTWKKEFPVCETHYMQLFRRGYTIHGRNEPNEINIKDDYAEIILYDLSYRPRNEVALISLDKIDIIKEYRWHKDAEGYVSAWVNGKSIRMHKLIFEQLSETCDHINKNRLDNRNENVRPATYSQNNANSSIRSDNSSGIKGVRFNDKRKDWIVEIRFEGKRVVKYFKELADAIECRKALEEKLHGEFASREG